MGVALVKNNTNGDDPRSTLREAIAARAVAHAKAELQQQTIHRARDMLRDAEAKLGMAGEALESARSQHAETLAEAAQTGTGVPRGNTPLRAARQQLSDSEDEASAARTALEQLQGDRGDDRVALAENAVLTAVAAVLAPVGEELLARARRTKAELLILMQTLYEITNPEERGVPLFGGEIQTLNARDARAAPLASLRDQVLKLSLEATRDEWAAARETAARWKEAKLALRTDSDAGLPL